MFGRLRRWHKPRVHYTPWWGWQVDFVYYAGCAVYYSIYGQSVRHFETWREAIDFALLNARTQGNHAL